MKCSFTAASKTATLWVIAPLAKVKYTYKSTSRCYLSMSFMSKWIYCHGEFIPDQAEAIRSTRSHHQSSKNMKTCCSPQTFLCLIGNISASYCEMNSKAKKYINLKQIKIWMWSLRLISRFCTSSFMRKASSLLHLTVISRAHYLRQKVHFDINLKMSLLSWRKNRLDKDKKLLWIFL